ncbi:Protein of unknown function DUF361 [Methanocaldococcus vulcanius M7]|uniref:Class III signal peptide-containing protein n=1 Tax=Methanocaldococcus vulcanius (strain ATCC 700851 / DSM 12094 / M7) TaxID=579137 RepID=C9RI66_METVM|nr:class III signal peptide-containing protein [Methanocaldococcus vulcanius]ACX73268.1 Protein of unknown function DUF361 [Methanocaldococcus vulcanius M7]
MKILKKIMSKKGQLSMEVGILVAAAVLVAVIAGYYYVKNIKSSSTTAGEKANKTVTTLGEAAENISSNISKLVS